MTKYSSSFWKNIFTDSYDRIWAIIYIYWSLLKLDSNDVV